MQAEFGVSPAATLPEPLAVKLVQVSRFAETHCIQQPNAMTQAHDRRRTSTWRGLLAAMNESRISPFNVHPRFFYQGKSYKIRSAGRRFLLLINRWKKVSQDDNLSSLTPKQTSRAAADHVAEVKLRECYVRSGR